MATKFEQASRETPVECPESQRNRLAMQKQHATRRRPNGRPLLIMLGAYTILAIVLIELVLVNPSLRPVEAGKKKKIMKKLKEILPLIALLKRKKIVLLPIPM